MDVGDDVDMSSLDMEVANEVDVDIDVDIDIDIDMDMNEESIEKLWAKEQYEMSRDDREAATDELHGVKSRYNATEYENPENHYKALIQFDNQLNNPRSGIPSRLKHNYLRAMRMNSTYVSSSDFRLRFLRAEFFDVSKAIVRFCKCLNLLVELFGDASLLRQIFLSDLTKNERKLLKEGEMQLSPYRDSLGRRTFYFLGNVGANYSAQERDRVGIYLLFQVMAEDVTTQRNGLVSVSILTEDVTTSIGGTNRHHMSNFFLSIFQSCPLRFSAIHLFFPNEMLYRMLKSLLLFVVGKGFRKVLKIHSGTIMERNYSLSSFGIRLDDIPTTYSGTVKTRHHMRWLKVRSAMDDFVKQQCEENVNGDFRSFYASDQYTIQPFPHIQCPENNCVLFHKNGVAWEFPGNIKFRAFLDEQLPKYNHLNNRSPSNIKSTGLLDAPVTPPEKEGLFDRIIRLSLEQNFQFLLHDETKHWYIELKELDVLRRYIGFAIRGRQRRVSAQRHNSSNNNDFNNDNEANNTVGSNRETGTAVFTNMYGNEPNFGSGNNCFNPMR
jgi:hypothetical protein